MDLIVGDDHSAQMAVKIQRFVLLSGVVLCTATPSFVLLPARSQNSVGRLRPGGSHDYLQNRLNMLLNQAYQANQAAHGKRSIELCNEVLRIDPNCARAYAIRGWSFVELEEPEHAIADLKRALQLKFIDGNVYGQLAIAQMTLDQRKESIENFTSAFNLGHSTIWLEDRAKVHILQKEFHEAVADAERAMKNSATSAAPYQIRANANFSLGNYQKAVDDYTKAMSMNKSHASVIYGYRARCYEKLGRKDLAAKDMEKANDLARSLQ
jgi:tetratricopeptide (TPR) repeat protein